MKIIPSYGIKNMSIGNIFITTVKLKVGFGFDATKLPKEINCYPGRKGYILSYTSLATTEADRVCQELGKCLKEHAINKLNNRYSWVQP